MRDEYFIGGFLAGWLAMSALTLVWFLAEHEPVPEKVHTPRSQFGTSPPDCGHLYNVSKSREWADCVGVAIVPRVYLKRDDM